MRHRNRWKGRAQRASAQSEFENGLFGDDSTGRNTFDARLDRKTAQLCRQVQRALMLALAGECEDPVLQDLTVDAVEALGSASHLLVSVGIPRETTASVPEILGKLNAVAPRLRSRVAQSISRKRVPSLTFQAIPTAAATEVEREGDR